MGRPRLGWRLHLPAEPRLRRVLVAYALASLIEFSTWLAILLVAYDAGGPVLVGTASVAMLVPAIIAVPFLASLGDRMPRGRALSLSHAAVGLSSLAGGLLLAADAPLWAVLIPGATLSIAVSLVRPMHYAALPLLSHRAGDLVAANSLSSFVEGSTVFIGFLVSGIITDHLGAWVVLTGASALGLTAALLTRGLHLPQAVVEDGDGVGEIRAALQGFVALRGNWGALALLLLISMLALLEGADDTLTVTWNGEVLGLGGSTAGLLAGAYGLGIAIGGAVQAGVAHRRRLAPLVLAGALTVATAEASVALLGALAPAFVVLMLAGIGLSMVSVSARTLLQRSTDNVVLARVLAIQEGVHLVGLTLGAVVGPLLVSALGPSLAFVPVPAAVAVLALSSYVAVRGLDLRATYRPRELALLSQVPFLAALAPYELEHLAQGSQRRFVPMGTPVVTQGGPGDAFYVVATGELDVTVDGRLRDHTLGPGDGFGEIALLNGGTRTATVTAVTDCDLLMLSPELFLAAVTSSVDGLALATGVSRARLESDRPG